MNHFDFHLGPHDEFIRNSQRRKFFNFAEAHRHALVGLRKAAWLLSRELRELEKIYTSHAADKRSLEIDTDRTPRERHKGASPADVLYCSIVISPASDLDCDIVSTVAAEEPSRASARASAVLVPTTHDALSVRQRNVLRLIMQGMSNKEMARALKLAEGTVKIHVSALFRNLGVHNRSAVAAIGARLLRNGVGSE